MTGPAAPLARGRGGAALCSGAPVALYAPMKPPDHPTPSGDREIARLIMAALTAADLSPRVVSRLRSLDMAGDADAQARLEAEATREAERLVLELAPDPPAAWVTYHCYYKAPDLLGPAVSAALGLPYLIVEPSISPARRDGPWARFAALSDAAIGAADRLLWTTERDRPALAAAGHGPRMEGLPPFVAAATPPPARGAHRPLRLLTVAMMRPGDKLESYARLARALGRVDMPWSLEVIGDGPVRGEVEALFSSLRGSVDLRGVIEDQGTLRAAYEASDLFLWPGVNEGVGMVWLEAQAAACPVIAEHGPASAVLVGGGRLVPPDDAPAFARAIAEAAEDRAALAASAARHIAEHHGLEAAARRLRGAIEAVRA